MGSERGCTVPKWLAPVVFVGGVILVQLASAVWTAIEWVTGDE